ncbi:RimK family alpha-L-glutamate ligase [Streptomyces sp. UNOC14_S4]|uniref:ATP-grasp domain-containing protein n=1 Tax=Streptomyces sp. UNOC14_S4 TaxID=2872340 RepID=UPI001E6001EB|nr:hypothetical protein [Streptomyces sp. UNOC14_S4]MCC3771726.1 hypothetical protein [Streptomyces sp. UNOC14_S4]
MSGVKVAVVSSGFGVEHDDELPLVVEALRARGMDAEPVIWDDGTVAWERFELAVIRSAWDYVLRPGEFLAWADATACLTRLWNPAPVVRWNSDKRYLLELARHGVPVVPTRVVEPGQECGAADFAAAGGVVVKPAVSGGARDTARYEPGQEADALRHARMLLDTGRAVIVQPYLRRVEEGERALIFLSGEFSHAILKGPVLTEAGLADSSRDPHPGVTPYRPTEAETRTARAALAAVPGGDALLFARVDLALDDAGNPVVMEVELIEPYLFLQTEPRAVRRFADGVAAHMTGSSSSSTAPLG